MTDATGTDSGGATGSSSGCGWIMAAPDATKASTLKAVWAARAFGVPWQSTTARATTTERSGTPKRPTAVAYRSPNGEPPTSSDWITGTGGNSMALAIALSSSNHNNSNHSNNNHNNSTLSLQWTDACRVDEWCEWERTVLRPIITGTLTTTTNRANTTTGHTATTNTFTAPTAVWRHLEQALVSSPSPFLVGTALSVADICVATTLLHYHHHPYGHCPSDDDDTVAQLPPAVQRFRQAHQAAYQAAVAEATRMEAVVSVEVVAAGDRSMVAAAAAAPMMMIDMNEPSLLQVVDTVFRNTIAHVFGPAIELPKNIVKLCTNPKHGDYQVSAAMPIFAALKAAGHIHDYAGPTQVATALLQSLASNHAILTELTTQGPGFILCRLQPSYLQHHVTQFLYTRHEQLPMPTATTRQTCVVDFSSPNIAKEMHVGHLRSTIIGEAVCRILEAAGHCVHRVNHVGDWGTQFGMLIQYLKEEYPHVVASDNSTHDTATRDTHLPNITDLTVFYKNAKQRFDENPDFKKMAQTNVVKLQSGDAECLAIWKMLCDVSRREFQKVYNRLDVKCDEYGESYYNTKIPAVIEEFVQANQIKIEEGGAKCVFVDKFKIPLMLQKSDGGYGYDSTDMAALKYRLHDLQADRVIVITDFSQGDHFKMVFQAGEAIGWLNRGQQLQHIGFGTVQGEDGKRFKTRSGDTVRLVDLLDESVQRMEGQLKTRIDEGKANITVDELHEVAEAIGYGAVKYFDLRRNPTSNYKFSYDQMLDTKGDTAVYLLYARVRLESIMVKAATPEFNVTVADLLAAQTPIVIAHESERNLALQLLQFTDTMEQTLEDLYPFHICEYVYKLATAASDFVTQCRVLGSPEMESRILLCHATTSAMRQCFDLLGIRHVKRI